MVVTLEKDDDDEEDLGLIGLKNSDGLLFLCDNISSRL
jgi:hypothetical protein